MLPLSPSSSSLSVDNKFRRSSGTCQTSFSNNLYPVDVVKHTSPMPTIRHAPSFPIFTTSWSPALYNEKNIRSGVKWYKAPESTTHVVSSLTRCSSLSLVLAATLLCLSRLPLCLFSPRSSSVRHRQVPLYPFRSVDSSSGSAPVSRNRNR